MEVGSILSNPPENSKAVMEIERGLSPGSYYVEALAEPFDVNNRMTASSYLLKNKNNHRQMPLRSGSLIGCLWQLHSD